MGFSKSRSVFYEAFKRNLGFTSEEAAWPYSLMSTFIHLSGLMFSPLMYYVSIRKIAIIGSILAATGSIVCYFSTNFLVILFALGVINGMGIGIFYSFNPVIIGMYFNRYKTRAMGIATCGSSIGSFVLAPLSSVLIENYGIKGSFLIFGGIILQCLPAACLYYEPKMATDTENSLKNESDTNDKFKVIKISWDFFKNPLFLMISFTFSIYHLYMSILLTIILDFTVKTGINKFNAIFFIPANAITDLIARLAVGWILDLGIISKVKFVIICFFWLGGLTCSLPYLWEYVGFLIIFCAIGIGFGCLRVEQHILLTEYVDLTKLPVAIGFTNFIIGFVLFLQVPIIAYFEEINRYDYLFYLLASLLFISAFVWMLEPLINKCQNRNNQVVP
ncbi:monocarboxylate transporter 2-like [Centruroides sculpturatus]|uniref:monocarboxylate transporter 2-like n=1 Tax=Centruroides sculpturatus TaxID=218467 RepID=UPI000C6CFB2F|nr:monocarboxylate transporter 2-like [Centruroides sculpturatus]